MRTLKIAMFVFAAVTALALAMAPDACAVTTSNEQKEFGTVEFTDYSHFSISNVDVQPTGSGWFQVTYGDDGTVGIYNSNKPGGLYLTGNTGIVWGGEYDTEPPIISVQSGFTVDGFALWDLDGHGFFIVLIKPNAPGVIEHHAVVPVVVGGGGVIPPADPVIKNQFGFGDNFAADPLFGGAFFGLGEIEVPPPAPEPSTIVGVLSGLLMLSFRGIFRLGEGRQYKIKKHRSKKK